MKNSHRTFLVIYDFYEDGFKAVYNKDTPAYESYLNFFVYLSNKDFDIYIIRDLNNNNLHNEYIAQFKFVPNTRTFEKSDTKISPDCIWDKTSALNFPVIKNDKNVINPLLFKELETNKWVQSQLFKEYFPQNILCNDLVMFKQYIERVNTSKIVIKPLGGHGGKGISFFEKAEVLNDNFDFNNLPQTPFLIQSFTDTSAGVKDICDGIHDLRFIYLNKQLVLCILRQPAKGQLRANFAQGGTFEKIPLSNIPQYILDFLKPIANKIIGEYENPYFSIDLGIENEKPMIFEITGSRVSFPIYGWDNESFYEQFYQHIISKIS